MEKSQKKAQKRTSTGDTEVHDGNTTKVVDCKDQGRRAEKDMVSSIACISVRLCKEMLLKPRYLFWPAVPSSEPLSCHTSGIWGGEQHVTRVGDWWSGGREEALHKDANPTALLGQEAWVTDNHGWERSLRPSYSHTALLLGVGAPKLGLVQAVDTGATVLHTQAAPTVSTPCHPHLLAVMGGQ